MSRSLSNIPCCIVSRYHYKHLQSCTGWQGAIMPAELCAGLMLESTERTLRAAVWRWAWSGQGTAAEALPRVFTHRGVTGGQVEAGASERRKHGILTHNCHGPWPRPRHISSHHNLAGAMIPGEGRVGNCMVTAGQCYTATLHTCY